MINLKDLHFESFELPGIEGVLHTTKYYNNNTIMCSCKIDTVNTSGHGQVYCVELYINKLDTYGEIKNNILQTAFFNNMLRPVMDDKELGGNTNNKFHKSYISDKYLKFVMESITLYNAIYRR